MKHVPVLLQEVIHYLDPQPGEDFIDATFGGGGHAREILKKTAPEGRLLGIDWDPTIGPTPTSEVGAPTDSVGVGQRGSRLDTRPPSLLKESEPLLGRSGIESGSLTGKLFLEAGNFAEIAAIAEKYFPSGVDSTSSPQVDGVLFDFGFSTDQLESSGRGFSYLKNEPLDMRFYRSETSIGLTTAVEIVNTWPERELERIFRELGEERQAKRIAKNIAAARKIERIVTTGQLVQILNRTSRTNKSYRSHKTYARIFQALRIAVNDELTNIQRGLAGAWRVLKPGGRLAAISFHSLEDRIVKNFFNEKKREMVGRILTKKPVTSSAEEIANNSRARSAKLRVIKKI